MNLESNKDKILQEDLESLVNNKRIPDELNNSTILVTGATGLVGSQLIKALLCNNRLSNSNINVIGLARNEQKVKQIFKDVINRKELSFVYADINDVINIEDSIDYIVHGASVTSSKIFVTKPVEVIKTSIDGTFNLLQLAKEKKVKGFVYLSSMEMYGVVDHDKKYADESMLGNIDVLSVRSCYSEGKRMCENLCASFASEYDVPVTIARLSQTFGSGVSKDETRVFAQFIRSAINKEDIILHTKGESYGNYCYTCDTIAALLLLLVNGKKGEAYNVSNEKTNIMIKDMASLVADKLANNEIKVIFDIPEDALKYGYAPDVKLKLNANKLMNLGWKPTYDLEEMYIRTMKSFLEQ